MKFIFEEAENTVDTETLEDLKKMAKGKLISIQRMYGALDEDFNSKSNINVNEHNFEKENTNRSQLHDKTNDLNKISENINQQENNTKKGKIRVDFDSSKQEEQVFEKIGDLTRNMEKEILSKTETDFLKNLFSKVNIEYDDNEPYKPKYEEFLKSDAFNKDIVNRYHEQTELYNQRISEAFEEAQKRKKENNTKTAETGEAEAGYASGKFEIENYLKDGKINKIELENYIRGVLQNHGVKNIDEQINGLNLDEAIATLEREYQEEGKYT